MTRVARLAAVALVLSVQATPAFAHAERSASSPREGATIAAPPEALNVTFTEPPTGDAVVRVLDGCNRDVVADVQVQNFEITAPLDAGQPGKWTVETNVISGIDGHNTRDRWTFGVRGSADCSAPETDAPGAAGDETDEEDGGSSALPLLALAGVTIALIVVGLVVRRRGE